MTERPDLQKSKMAALAAEIFRTFSHKIAIVMYEPLILFFKGRGAEGRTNILCFSNSKSMGFFLS